MKRYAAALLSVAIVCGASCARAVAQTHASYETQEAKAMRLKLEEVERMAETEFDRGRESLERRTARAKFEVAQGFKFDPLSVEDKALLAPPEEDAARFAALLAQPDTGLVRLMPRERKEGRPSVREGGALYSFAHLVHEYRYGSDIMLEQNRLTAFSVGAGLGFLFDLGEMPLEEATTETGPVKLLAAFVPPTAEAEARKIQLHLHDGYQQGWFVYRKRIPAVVGHTYVLRTVDYRVSDLLVAFQVLRREPNGDVILLWKMLKRFPTPQLRRE
ncbi:MAG TPA: hypothetical protein VFX96_16265 [Pyrinomonadaceae bacterium]|nr:hypothetical protein [Pyrinomonadaceae bacterium]